jgi:hypothetical protein
MTLRNGKLATKVIALLLGSASLGATAFAQAQKSAAPAQAVKPGAVAAPTPSPTPTPGSTKAKPAGAAQPGSVQIPPGPPVAPATKSPTALSAASLAGSADVDQMTSQQFKALPSTGMVRYKGQSMTKAGFIEQRKKEFLAQQKTVHSKASIDSPIMKAQFEQKQAADLAAKNGRVKAAADGCERRLKQLSASPAYSALAKEADGIVQRYPSASSAEKAKLKQRAAEIHTQLLKMEQGAVSGH